MNKILLFVILLINISLGTEITKGDCIKTLYINRNVLIETYSKCKGTLVYNKLFIPCGGKKTKNIMDTLIGNEKKELNDWYKNKKNILKCFDFVYASSHESINSEYTLVRNEELIALAISLLCDTTDVSDYALKTGAHLLYRFTSYPDLTKQSYLIRKYMVKHNIDKKLFQEMLIYTVTDKGETDSLLKLKSLPLHYRARLGDSIAEDSLIAQFKGEKNYGRKIDLVEKIFFVGSQKCQKKIIAAFNDSIYEICYQSESENMMKVPQIIKTIKMQILFGFYKLYPDIPIIGREFSKFMKNETNPTDTLAIKSYEEKFLQWGYEQFNIKPEIEKGITSFCTECPIRTN